MLKKDSKDKKIAVNRKLLIWIFGLTGLVSLFFWWRGRLIRGGGVIDPSGSEIRFVMEPTKPVTVNSNSKQLEKLLTKITEIASTASGTYAVYVYHLEEGSGYGINERKVMGGASLLKIPVIVTAINKIEKGELRFEDKYTLEEADRAIGSGPLQFKKAGSTYTIDELLTYLGRNSDNTAWVMFNRRFGKAAMQKTIEKMNLTETNYETLDTTAMDVANMWLEIYSGEIAVGNKKKIWGYLTKSIYEDRIPAGLTGTGAEIVGHKVGTDADVWADAGIVKCRTQSTECRVKPFVLVIMNEGVKRAEATGIVPEIVKLIWRFENGEL